MPVFRPERTQGVGRHLNHQFAVAQNHQPLLVIEAQVHRAVRVQTQAAAVGQREILTLATAGVQIRQQRVTQRAADAEPSAAAQQTETRDHAERIAA
ncbi:hypothetical protein D3C84_615740 [compost metagenome]